MTTTPAGDTSSFRTESHCPHGVPWAASQIHAALDPRHSRWAAPGDPADERIDALWLERRNAAPNAKLFNGLKFRLDRADVIAVGERKPPHLFLRVGLSDYKSHVGTNARPVVRGETAYDEGDRDAALSMANILGVEACVVTSDGFCVLFRRSDKVAEFPGFWCCPGGHAEPFRVFAAADVGLSSRQPNPCLPRIDEAIPARKIRDLCDDWIAALLDGVGAGPSDVDNTTGAEHKPESFSSPSSSSSPESKSRPRHAAAAAQQAVSALVVNELFFSIADEVSSEIGVPIEAVDVAGLLGVAWAVTPSQRGKPDLIFAVRVALPFDEVKRLFAVRQGEDAFEAVDGSLVGIAVGVGSGGDASSSIDDFLRDQGGKVTPASLAALRLAQRQWLVAPK